jgi:hypothetical protein
VVLRRRADHRRAADVDVLERLVLAHVQARHRAFERVEVHAHEVDLLDPFLLERLEMSGVVADREQRRVELRVQRLDAAVEDLGRARQVLHASNLDARLAQRFGGAARRDDLDPQRREARSELGDPGLVRDGHERAAHAQRLTGRGGSALALDLGWKRFRTHGTPRGL